uniref:glutathione transferase n=1 Tax=Ananas comosus var. bracteatus TaxID=296719 RepID=A0A6V7PX54_ANACO|nr:unnamed protein product [Ananas comosus var. bracteatus]
MAASGDEVKLLGRSWGCPYVIRVRIALELKGVSYDYVVEQLGEKKSELLLKSNPVYKKVPVLIHNDRPICESAIIVQYIDEVWAGTGPSILPSDPYERAIARFWTGYIDDTWFPALFKIIKVKTEKEKAEALEQSFVGLSLLEEACKKGFEGKAFFGGDNVGYLDIIFGSFLGWVKAIEKISDIKLIDEAKFPLLAKWAERFASVTTVKEHVPKTDELVELFSKCFPALLKIIKVKVENEKAEGIKQSFVGLGLIEEAYEKSFKGKPFFGGDNVGYLDIAFETFLCWVKMTEKISGIKLFDEAKFPLLAKWAERFDSVTTLKEHIPKIDKMVELYWKVIKPIWDTSAPKN